MAQLANTMYQLARPNDGQCTASIESQHNKTGHKKSHKSSKSIKWIVRNVTTVACVFVGSIGFFLGVKVQMGGEAIGIKHGQGRDQKLCQDGVLRLKQDEMKGLFLNDYTSSRQLEI